MGKRFVPSHEADKRAIEFYSRLREIEQMSGVGVEIASDRKSIILFDKNNSKNFWTWAVDGILCLHPKEAKGGSYQDLATTHRKRTRVPSATVRDEVRLFLSGDDE